MTVTTLTKGQTNAQARGRGKVYDNIIETIGDTPLVRLNRITKEAGNPQ